MAGILQNNISISGAGFGNNGVIFIYDGMVGVYSSCAGIAGHKAIHVTAGVKVIRVEHVNGVGVICSCIAGGEYTGGGVICNFEQVAGIGADAWECEGVGGGEYDTQGVAVKKEYFAQV